MPYQTVMIHPKVGPNPLPREWEESRESLSRVDLYIRIITVRRRRLEGSCRKLKKKKKKIKGRHGFTWTGDYHGCVVDFWERGWGWGWKDEKQDSGSLEGKKKKKWGVLVSHQSHFHPHILTLLSVHPSFSILSTACDQVPHLYTHCFGVPIMGSILLFHWSLSKKFCTPWQYGLFFQYVWWRRAEYLMRSGIFDKMILWSYKFYTYLKRCLLVV